MSEEKSNILKLCCWGCNQHTPFDISIFNNKFIIIKCKFCDKIFGHVKETSLIPAQQSQPKVSEEGN